MKNRNLEHKDHWQTPPDFYHELDKKYHFDFDPCPLRHNLDDWDGLEIEWGRMNFVNPPYSQKLKEGFVIRAACFKAREIKSICLLPVSTSTVLFHEWIKPYSSKIEFLKGRLKFIGINSKGQHVNYDQIQVTTMETILFEEKEIPKYIKNSGQHDSMLVIF